MERHGLASTDLMWPHSNDSGTDEADDTADSDDTSDPDDDDSEMGEAGEDGAMEVSGNESEDEDESDSESDIQQARASSATTSESDAEESDDESELDQPGEDVQMREFGIEDYDSESSDSDDSSCEDSDSEDFDSKDSDIEENTGEDADTSQPVAKRAQDGEVNNLQGPTGSKRKRPQSKHPEGKEPQKNDLQKQTKNDEAATAELSNRAFDTSHYTNFTATNATVCVESPTGPWYEITSPVRCTCCGQKKGTPGSVVIATDGSCLNMLNKNEAGIIPSPAACSIFFHPESKLNYSWMLPGEVETSLRAEYTGTLWHCELH